MKKPIPILLLCCLVLAMGAPVSADYFWYKDVSAGDFVNALVDYCNHNEVRNMTGYDIELSNHPFKSLGVVRTSKSLEFRFECKDDYCTFCDCPLTQYV